MQLSRKLLDGLNIFHEDVYVWVGVLKCKKSIETWDGVWDKYKFSHCE